MDPMMEASYLRLATDNPMMRGSEVPIEVLEAACSVDEPTEFLREFFAAGHKEWLAARYGRAVPHSKEQIENAAIALWTKACYLHTSRIMGRPDEEWYKPFFRDEDLYSKPG